MYFFRRGNWKLFYDGYTDLLDFTIGISFLYAFNDRLKIYYGIGPNISFFSDYFENSFLDRSMFGIGIGRDAGLKYHFYAAIPYSFSKWVEIYRINIYNI